MWMKTMNLNICGSSWQRKSNEKISLSKIWFLLESCQNAFPGWFYFW